MSKELSAIRSENVGKDHRISDLFAKAIAPVLYIGSMCSMQHGAALSRPATIQYGTVSTTWLRLVFAAFVLAVIVRPPLLLSGNDGLPRSRSALQWRR